MKRILVIEDSPEVRSLLLEMLEEHGWHALGAGDGEEGLALARAQLPDLILCDIRMPKRDGYSVLEELRSEPATASIPFVFLTGLGEKPNVRQGMELGADDYLVKPFTTQELTAAVEARLRKHATIAQLAEQKLEELRGTLNSALPHEMVAPLNSILGFSSFISEAPELTLTDAREYAGHIFEAGQRLHQVIEKFAFFARLEVAAKDPQNKALFAVAEPTETRERISALAQRIASKRDRAPDLRCDLQPLTARITQGHLDRLAEEIIENAFKFSEPGTPVQVTATPDKGEFHLLVTNRGYGLSPEQIARVGAHVQFDRGAHEQQGTGLGLAIVNRLAALYNGSFWIESVPNEATSVHLTLPA